MSDLDKYLDMLFKKTQLEPTEDRTTYISNNEELKAALPNTPYHSKFEKNTKKSVARSKILKHKLNLYFRDDSSDSTSIKNNFFSYATTPLVYKDLNISTGDVVLDLGGYIGAFAHMCTLSGAKVVSYEPDAESLQLFNLNSNTPVYNMGVGSIEETAMFYKYNWHLGNSFYPEVYNSNYFTIVESYNALKVAFKDVLYENNYNTIKCDINGDELLIDWSALPINIKKVAIKFNPYKIPLGLVYMNEIIFNLNKQGFKNSKKFTVCYTNKTRLQSFNMIFLR